MSMPVPLPLLPYAWVRSHGVMLAEAGGAPVLLGTTETAAWAVAELRRRHGPVPFQVWMRRFGSSGWANSIVTVAMPLRWSARPKAKSISTG